MEGDGPLNGTATNLSTILLSDDPVAADVVCARMLGLVPEQVRYIREASLFLGNAKDHELL
jgi:uncharacterized protein (DUF362 family)